MSNELTIQDLPDEMLEQILLHLSLCDRKSARSVCKHWSRLKPFEWSSVQLVINTQEFDKEDYQEFHRAFLAFRWRYKHICFSFGSYFQRCDLIVDILRNLSQSVESLQFSFFWTQQPINLILFAKISEILSNLKYLYVNYGKFESDRGNMTFSPMNKLEGLYLYDNQIIPSIPNMQDITPNITRLQLDIESKESVNFLQHLSSQLVELEAVFESGYGFLAVCRMQFPCLKNARFKRFSFVDDAREEITQLCKSLGNVQFLYLLLRSDLDPDSLLAICNLKYLKSLHLVYFSIRNVPRELNFPPLEKLHMLTLDEVEIDDHFTFNRFCQFAFPSLAILEIIRMDPYLPDVGNDGIDFELHYDVVCSNMSSLKRLVIAEPYLDLPLGPFLKFCASRAPRELKIRCGVVLDKYSQEELRPIPVETLILETVRISPGSLRHLIKSMGALKRLTLCYGQFSYENEIYHTKHKERIQILRDEFPRCEIVEAR